jgi:hypothetical protein
MELYTLYPSTVMLYDSFRLLLNAGSTSVDPTVAASGRRIREQSGYPAPDLQAPKPQTPPAPAKR